MENQNNKYNQKGILSLPQLLPGSEYKTDDSDLYRSMNLLGFAVAIVVCAKKDSVSDDCKEAWFKSFEEEYKRAQQHCKRTINFNAQHSSNVTPIPDDTNYANPVFKMIFDWLRKSQSDTPNWSGLYRLTKIQIVMLKKNSSAEWWNGIQNICRRAETTVDTFDPITEIHEFSEKYRLKDEPSLVKTSEEEDIPGEHRTSPMSQTELADLWGGDMTQKAIKRMMKKKNLRYKKQSRQKFIFDKRDLPKHVKDKLLNLEQ